MNIIEWCNANNGFLTGVLSLLTLVVSVIAVIVSIQTARLPYKKKLILTSDITVLFEIDDLTGQVVSQFNGITVNAINIGNRNVNVKFLGFAIRKDFKLQKIQTRNHELGGTGILAPTAVAAVEYTPAEMLGFSKLRPKTKVYCFALDTEGRGYKRYYGRAGKIVNNIKRIH